MTPPQYAQVESWTRIERPPRGFEAPLVVALVLRDDGTRAFAMAPPELALRFDTRVRLVTADDGRLHLEPAD